MSFAAFPDIETVLIHLLGDLADGHADTVLPADFTDKLPFLRVTRLGGPSTRFVDTPRIDIDAFAATRADAFSIAESVCQRLLRFPVLAEGCVIDSVTVDVRPHEGPWANPNVRRFIAAYAMSFRRPVSA